MIAILHKHTLLEIQEFALPLFRVPFILLVCLVNMSRLGVKDYVCSCSQSFNVGHQDQDLSALAENGLVHEWSIWMSDARHGSNCQAWERSRCIVSLWTWLSTDWLLNPMEQILCDDGIPLKKILGFVYYLPSWAHLICVLYIYACMIGVWMLFCCRTFKSNECNWIRKMKEVIWCLECLLFGCEQSQHCHRLVIWNKSLPYNWCSAYLIQMSCKHLCKIKKIWGPCYLAIFTTDKSPCRKGSPHDDWGLLRSWPCAIDHNFLIHDTIQALLVPSVPRVPKNVQNQKAALSQLLYKTLVAAGILLLQDISYTSCYGMYLVLKCTMQSICSIWCQLILMWQKIWLRLLSFGHHNTHHIWIPPRPFKSVP